MKLLSDGTDLEGVERTQDIPYMKILRRSMRLLDAWPKGPNDSKMYRYYLFTLHALFLVGGLIYLRNNTGKLSSFEIGHTYITVFMNIVAVSRSMMIISQKYNKALFYFLNEMHLFNYRNKSDYSYKIHIMVHKMCHFFTIYLIALMCLGILLFNATPMYNSYSDGMYSSERPENSTFDLSVYFSLPFDYTTNYKGYSAVFCINWYLSCTCSSYFCIVDLIISLMVFHLWGHMRILRYNLESFPKPASLLVESGNDNVDGFDNKYTQQEMKEVHNLLRDNIHYHSVIINFQARMSDTFGEVLLLYLLFHQVSECLLMLECSQMNQKSLIRYGPLTVVIFQQLIQLSIIFELLGSSNDKLIDAAYCIPWQYMDTKNRKLMLVLITQSQRSMNVKAMGVLSIGVETMITILKTSFSYFVILRTVAEEEE
uniref:Odorant receptor n=1 Tax=Sesamia inferens TaxID=492764 RepID=U5NG03_SESIF|nr:putative odorant receptor [Sesamia inferens]